MLSLMDLIQKIFEPFELKYYPFIIFIKIPEWNS